jgi:hypothetical protein
MGYEGGWFQMTTDSTTTPVEDSVPKVDGSVAVGEDPEFQRRWWRFEHIVWSLFLVIVVCDLLGLLGRGYLSKAERNAADQTINLKYEKIERANAPSMMSINFGPSAIRDGKIHLFVSESVVKELGARRVVPEPASSTLGGGGVTYIFPATILPATVEFELSPSHPGIHSFTMGVVGAGMVTAKVTVLP